MIYQHAKSHGPMLTSSFASTSDIWISGHLGMVEATG